MCRWLIWGFCTLLLLPAVTWAEVKTFEVSVKEAVSRNQSQEAVEAFALQKAKRLAVEQAGTYLSTMTVVEKGRMSKDEVTALASGIVRTEVVSSKAVVRNGQVYMKVTAKVAVDTSVLENQVETLLKDRAWLTELEAKDRKMRELEKELAQVKGVEVERLRKLNAQAVALEMEREKQRLFLEEQRLKAQGDMAKAELARLAEERERAARFEKLRKQQEAARQNELAAIAQEQDRIKKAQLENQANAAELARTAELARAKWVAVDDRLSAQQAKTEAESIRAEITAIIQSLQKHHQRAIGNLRTAYQNQISATKPLLLAPPTAKDPFETKEEYNQRLANHQKKVKTAENTYKDELENIKYEEKLKLFDLSTQASENKQKILEPFFERLDELQNRLFVFPDKKVQIEINAPDAEKSRFPIIVRFNNSKYEAFWNYTDRDRARVFYQTRAHLLSETLYRLQPKRGQRADFIFVGMRITHPGTGEKRDIILISPRVFREMKRDRYFIKYADGIIEDIKTGLVWVAGPDEDMVYTVAREWVSNLDIAGGGWRMPMRTELQSLYKNKMNSNHLIAMLETSGLYIWSGESIGDRKAWLYGYRSGDFFNEVKWDSKLCRAFAVREPYYSSAH